MPKRLLPLIPAGLLVQQLLPSPDHVIIEARPGQQSAACPDCGVPSERVHSLYGRTLGDLPWQGRAVTLRVQARRFRCLAPSCPRQTFAECLTGVAPRSARRTERLGDLQRHLGLALGGEAGARLAERLAVPTSADTLLRMTVRAPKDVAAPTVAPRVLAVDASRARRDGRGAVVAATGRSSSTWNATRSSTCCPTVRPRAWPSGCASTPASRSSRATAPGPMQMALGRGRRMRMVPCAPWVADRWHLLRNLGDAVRAVVDRQHAAVRRAAKQVGEQMATSTAATPAAIPDDAEPPTAAARRSQASRARRQARYEDAARLHAAGASISRIAVQLGADRKTVRGWLRAGRAPLWRKPPRAGILARYHDHLERRWTDGCRNAARLWRELVELGFPGRPGTVRKWAERRRKSELRSTAGAGASGMHVTTGQPPSGRHVARMLMADADALPGTERAFVLALLAQAPGLADGIAVAKRMHLLLRKRSEETLAKVLDDAADTLLAEFAASLRRDLAAVQAALDLPWTTSPAEGQINRLKMLKRTMYGRAGFQLLRARVLHAA